jgi:CDGSH-type Zn-finger protein
MWRSESESYAIAPGAYRLVVIRKEKEMAIKITCKKNGPYRVEGDLSQLELVDADGNKYDLTGKPGISLCRCGGSVNKPFCDGTHSKLGFQAAEAAVKQSEGGTPNPGQIKM